MLPLENSGPSYQENNSDKRSNTEFEFVCIRHAPVVYVYQLPFEYVASSRYITAIRAREFRGWTAARYLESGGDIYAPLFNREIPALE